MNELGSTGTSIRPFAVGHALTGLAVHAFGGTSAGTHEFKNEPEEMAEATSVAKLVLLLPSTPAMALNTGAPTTHQPND